MFRPKRTRQQELSDSDNDADVEAEEDDGDERDEAVEGNELSGGAGAELESGEDVEGWGRAGLRRSAPAALELGAAARSRSGSQTVPEHLARHPALMNAVRRPGHNNPYRSGIGQSDTVGALFELVQSSLRLVPRDESVSDQDLAGLDQQLAQLDGQIKRVNDEQETGILRQLASLHATRNEAEDAEDQAELATLGERIKGLLDQLNGVAGRDSQKAELRRRWRQIYERVVWLSVPTRLSPSARRQEQVRQLWELEGDENFAESFTLAQEAGTDVVLSAAERDEEDVAWEDRTDTPGATSGHAEQQIVASDRWSEALDAIAEDAREAAKGAGRDLGADDLLAAVAQALGRRGLTVSLNRSPCPVCNAFLISELIRFWKGLARDLIDDDSQWATVRDAFADTWEFGVSYSVTYAKSSRAAETLNVQLARAGWTVGAHPTTSGSDTEAEHEKLRAGAGKEGALASVRPPAKRSRGARSRRADSDDEWVPQARPATPRQRPATGEGPLQLEVRPRTSPRRPADNRMASSTTRSDRSPRAEMPEAGQVMALVRDAGGAVHQVAGDGMACYIRSLVTGLVRRGLIGVPAERATEALTAVFHADRVRFDGQMIDAGSLQAAEIRRTISDNLHGRDIGVTIVQYNPQLGRLVAFQAVEGAEMICLLYTPGHFDYLELSDDQLAAFMSD